MNEEALQYSFELFTNDGYEGTIEEYKELLKNDQEALDYSYDLFSRDGYDGNNQEYNKLIGAVQEDTQDFPTAVATETAPVTADATAEDTDLALVDTSLESQSNAPFVIDGQPATEQEFNEYKKDLAERDVLEKDESFFSATGFVDFFSDIATAAEEGWRQGELIDPAFELYSLGDKSTDQDVLNFVNKNKEVARKNLGSAEMREFNKTYEEEGGGFWGFIKGVVENPSTLSTMLVSSISSQISSLRSDEVRAAGAAAAATGAVAGSAIPVPGVSTLGGAVAGAMGGTMGAMETGLTFAELLQEEAGGLDPDKIKKILQDPEKLADLKNRALNRGVAIAAVEMATLGIAKGVGGKLATAGFKRAPMVAAGVTGAVEIAGGGLGEVAGRYVAGQEMDAAEIGFEAFAGLGSAPLTLGKQALNIQTNLDRVKINKEVNRTEYGNIVDVFKPETKTDGAEIKISKIKNSRKILDEKVDAQVKRAEITKEQGDAIKNNFRKTQGTVNQVKSLNLSESTEVEVVELQKEKLKLQAQIKEVNDKALTGTQLERVEAINKEQQSAIKEGRFTSRTKAATELATGLEFKEEPKVFNTTEEYIKAIAKEEGMSDKQASKAAKNSNGVFLGKGKIFIDKKVALEQGAVSVANHEVLHPILNAVIGDINKQRAILDDFKSKLNKSQIDWVQGQLDANVELANHDSEFLTYFSEGILNEQIKYDETVFTKLKEVVSKVFRKLGYNNIKFESGKDVYNFLKEYNNSILKNDKIQSSQVLKAIKKQETKKGVKASEVETVGRIQLSKTTQEQVDTLQEELDNLDEYDFTDEIEYDQAVANLENKIRTVKRKETLAKREVKKEVKEKVVADKKTFDNEGLVETIKSKETTRKEKSNAETELLESFDALALKAIKYDTRKGDYDRTEIRDYLRQFLPGIIDRYDPSESKFSTYVTNTMAPKAQQTYERFRKIADRSLDVTAGELGSVKETAAEESTSTQETVKKPSRKIKPIELIRNLGLQKKYKEAVKKIVEGGKALIDGNTFGNLKDLAAEVTAEIFDIPLLKVTDPADNLAFKDVIVDASNISKIKVYYPDAKVGMVIKSESSKIQDIIKSMGPDLFKLLPPENVAPELATVDAQAYKGVKGTGLKIPSSLMKAFYEATGKRSKGVTSQVAIKKLKPGLTYEQFLKELGIVKGQPNTYDRAIGQRLKAITTLFGKLATNTEVRQLEDVTDVQAQNIAAGKSDIQFSKSSKDLLNKYDLNYTEIRSKQDVDNYIKNMVKPLIDVFNSEDYKLLNRTVLQFRSKSLGGDKIISNYLRSELAKLNLPKRVSVGRTKPSSAIGNTVEKFKKSLNSGKIDKYNKKNSKVFDKMWNDINNIVSNDKNMAVPIMYFLENSINEATNPHRMGAPVTGYQLNAGKLYYEHAVQSQLSYLSLMESILDTNKDFKSEFDKIKDNYKVIAISESNNDKLNKSGYALEMPKNWKNWYDRYFNEKVAAIDGGINPYELIDIDGASFADKFKVDYSGKKISFSRTYEQNKKDFYSVWSTEAEMQADLYEAVEEARKPNNKTLPEGFRLSGDFTNQEVLDKMKELDDQQAEAGIQFSNSQNLDKDFNDILEKKSGIASDKEYKRVKAEVLGASKGRFSFFIPPSAEDFVGLLYATLGKNKTGDAQMAWYKKNLLNPFARAMENVSRDRNSLGRDFKALKKTLKIVPKNLKKKLPGEPFTTEQAVRVWIWNQIGKDVPGLDDADVKTLVDYVNSRPDLQSFGTEIMKLNKGTAYTSPTDSWNTGTITTDLLETLNTTKRKEYLELWQQNVDIIFSEKNLNKLEAIYGKQYRKAMENILTRMKTGKNRVTGSDSLTTRVTDWLTGSIGAIMFFNTRSAVLQTLSAVNFINFGDNNILAAGKAFANQKQYWTDFKKLFNSEFLIERRDGLKMNVNEADIADIAKEKGVRGVINKLLKLGFTPTQLADSFAIASGGSTFYRNRLNALIKGGMNTQAAEKQAMSDFREIAEESQQSSRPDKISQQQAGPLGRIVLAFANTPAQYARLIKKAASDLKNGRGDAKTNISKIIYYGVAQNLIFNALQQALFAISFGEDEEEDEKKVVGIANGMADSLLRGIGIGGAIISTVKNAGLKLAKENAKKNPKYEEVAIELLKISPPVASKIGKVRAAGRSYSWDKKEMKEKGWSLDNPAYLANANIISAASNIPLDRVIKKIDNITASTGANLSFMQRVALLAGWSEWQLGIDKDDKKTKSKKGRTINKRVINKRVVNKRTIN